MAGLGEQTQGCSHLGFQSTAVCVISGTGRVPGTPNGNAGVPQRVTRLKEWTTQLTTPETPEPSDTCPDPWPRGDVVRQDGPQGVQPAPV